MAKADDVEEEEVRESSEENHPSHSLGLDSPLHALVSRLNGGDALRLFELLLHLSRGAEDYPNKQKRDHREEDRVDCDPEVLDDHIPEQGSVSSILSEAVEEGIEAKLNQQRQEDQSKSHLGKHQEGVPFRQIV